MYRVDSCQEFRRFCLTTLALKTAFVLGALPAGAVTLQAAHAPGSNQTLALETIRSARTSLLINLYELTEPNIADAIEERIRAGVRVEILQEGHPVGGFSAVGRGIQSRLVQVMNETNGGGDRYFQMDPPENGSRRRYRFDHAKYMVVDGGALWIGSENFSPSGMPVPGAMGNRGWSALIQDSDLGEHFSAMFRVDTRTDFGDVTVLAGQAVREGYRAFFAALGGIAPADPVGVLGGATRTLDIEQMNLHPDWKTLGRASPLVEGLIAAARRGVRVRVLLNDERAFYDRPPSPDQNNNAARACEDPDSDACVSPDSPAKRDRNRETVDLLLATAAREHLPIEARIADLKAMGVTIIHNKGMIVDNRHVLVSSINWNENSVTRNREAAVAINSLQAANYFGNLFERDWRASANKARLKPRDRF